jgi:hypothetical protein
MRGRRSAACRLRQNFNQRRIFMNRNIDYLGLLNLLRAMKQAGVISAQEGENIAARLAAETQADIIAFC